MHAEHPESACSRVSDIHQSPRHRAAVRELRARGEVQRCWSCDTELRASARKPDPRTITLGHFVDVDLGLVPNPYDPAAYGPQCGACNYGGGARRTNAKRRGESGREVRSSPDWT